MEYLVTMTTQTPDSTTEETVEDIRSRVAAHSDELAAQGQLAELCRVGEGSLQLLRLWRPPLRPGDWRTLGLFAAEDGRAIGRSAGVTFALSPREGRLVWAGRPDWLVAFEQA
jgi:muconolactone delta-isomerase